ncbi:hypothetical protein A9P82_12830 [Arachidicoccus ginsenosidimutans]|uniref:hypothetical protein n=1 Tax=Arachidicoccus sp. BS20 TaxID=1850526 RepID=UPI0007F072E5|nr:hypothetical protein [Arachidicoccus sp. BS20]ANI90088.1 hypothetical protein A9P82_12830 [Arachidicoccus sp. BS20]
MFFYTRKSVLTLITAFLCLLSVRGFSQSVGVTVTPSRLYFVPGQLSVQRVSITNPSNYRPLEIGISMFDWKYDSLGSNVITGIGTLKNTLANYIKVAQGTYFTLKPGETKDVDVVCNVPKDADTLSYRTTMMYIAQLNPGNVTDSKGASFRVTVRIGIKLYQSSNPSPDVNLEIGNLYAVKDSGITRQVALVFDNTGNLWTNGKISYELLNNNTGKKSKMPDVEFYTLPGDHRTVYAKLPDNLPKGEYTLTTVLRYNDGKGIKIADLKMEL